MLSALLEIDGAEIPGAQFRERRRPGCGKLIEQLRESSCAGFGEVSKAFEGRKGLALAMLEDVPRARHPVDVLRVEIVCDDSDWSPGRLAFVGGEPCAGKVAEECIERRGRASKKSD